MATVRAVAARVASSARRGLRPSAALPRPRLVGAGLRAPQWAPRHIWFSTEAGEEPEGEEVVEREEVSLADRRTGRSLSASDLADVIAEATAMDNAMGAEPTIEMDDRVIQDLEDSGEDWSAGEEEDPSMTIDEARALVDPDWHSDEDANLPWSDEENFVSEAPADPSALLGDEWVYDHKNHVYFNTETKETLVRKAESNKLYEERRSQRSLESFKDPTKPLDKQTALATHATELELTNLYHPQEMATTRQRYQWVDFEKLGDKLDEADRRFFQASPRMNYVPFEPNLPFQLPEADEQDRHEAERAKFFKKLPVKFQVAEFRRSTMSRTGRVFKHGVLLLAGNGKGWISYGYGKGVLDTDATRRAIDALRKNLMDVPLLEGRTIYSTIVGRHGRTSVIMKRMPRGTGIIGGKFMMSVCECLGILDLSTKVIGPRNPMSVCLAIFEGLSRVVSSREMALRRGVNYYKMFEAGAEHEKAPTKEELAKRSKVIEEHIQRAEKLREDFSLTQEKLDKWGEHKLLPGRDRDNKRGWHAPYAPKETRVPKKLMQPKWIAGRSEDAKGVPILDKTPKTAHASRK